MTTTSSDLDLTAISQRYFDAWEARDPDRIVALHAPDTRLTIHAGLEPSVGREQTREAIAALFGVLHQFGFVVHRVITGDRHWVLDWTMTAVVDNDDGTSRPISVHTLDVVTVDDDGLVVLKDVFVDVAQYRQAFAPNDRVHTDAA